MEFESLWEIIPNTNITDAKNKIKQISNFKICNLINNLKKEIIFFNPKKFENIKYKYIETQFLGSELYIYISNNDFSIKRNPPKSCKYIKNFQFD